MSDYYTSYQKPESFAENFIETIGRQIVQWKQLPNGFKMEFEIVSPMRAKLSPYKSTQYILFLVHVLKNTNKPDMDEGDFVEFNMPLKTFNNAMYALPSRKKQCWNNLGTDNIYIKGIKKGESVLEFLEIERREITAEQKEKADEFYKDGKCS